MQILRNNIITYICLGLLVTFSLGCNRGVGESSNTPNLVLAREQPLVIQPTQSPTNGDSREPELSSTVDGRIIMSWVEKINPKSYALRAAIRDKNGWSETIAVAQGQNWFINWADFPSVISLPNGTLAAHWLVKSGVGTYAYNVNIALSKDTGKSWSKPIVPHDDNTLTEHGFVSLFPLQDGRLGAIWLDGRNMKDMKEDHGENKPLPVSMTLRYVAIDVDGNVSDNAQLDERVCECCQTSAAVTSEGVVAVYRDRSPDEIRDTSLVRQRNGSWGLPKVVSTDNWQIDGCPVNGPSVAADGRKVAVAWFSGAGEAPQAKVAFSNDAGETFGAPIQFDDGETIGRVDVSLLPDGSALVCWLSGTAEAGAIKVRRVWADGSLGPPAQVAKTDISRSSGFPRMARLGNEVYFAWTEFGKPSRVRMAVADVRR